jgi:hypothetical protein
MLLLIFVKVFCKLLPNAPKPAIKPTEINAASKPYSTAVAPRISTIKALRERIISTLSRKNAAAPRQMVFLQQPAPEPYPCTTHTEPGVS